MPEISASLAARFFENALDAVEHKGESFVIRRHGRIVARLEPAAQGSGADVKALLARLRTDAEWANDVRATRDLLTRETRE